LLALQAYAQSSTSQRRIQVIEGRRWVPIVAPTPTLSSGPCGSDGILVERHHSLKVLEDSERTTAIVYLHLGTPAQQEWPLDGERKSIPVVPGSIPLLPQGPSRSARIEVSTDAVVFSRIFRRMASPPHIAAKPEQIARTEQCPCPAQLKKDYIEEHV
jgi:hypothetical protein